MNRERRLERLLQRFSKRYEELSSIKFGCGVNQTALS